MIIPVALGTADLRLLLDVLIHAPAHPKVLAMRHRLAQAEALSRSTAEVIDVRQDD